MPYFHPAFETKIVADASKRGLGAVLLQKNPANSFFQPVTFASRSLSNAETRYSQTEREALAVIFSCERFKNFVYGLRFTIVTDHKPLLKLYSPPCSDPPTRTHRWSLRLQEFDFKLEYQLGLNNIADILSRKPFFDIPKVNETEHFVNYVVSNSTPKTLTYHEIREATQNEQILAKVCDAINNNRWKFYKNDIHVKQYYVLRKELIFHDGVILRKQRLVIPHCLHRSVLRLAHEGHIGIVKCKARLRSKVWWPHIDSEVSPFISECHSCQIALDYHHPAPMMPIPMPELLWLSVAVDLRGPFPTGETLLILVDYYSRFPFVEILKNTTSATIISKLCKIFSVHGLPEILTSDNGGQFTSNEMESFLKINRITNTRTTPLWSQANGQVE